MITILLREPEAGAVAGTDCDDSTSWWNAGAATYRSAGENEADPTLCMEDADEDGYGAEASHRQL